MANPNRTPSGTVIGNLGGNPEVRETKEQTYSYMGYDPLLDDMVERDGIRQAGEFRTFSIAVQEEHMDEPKWIQCVDWNNLSKLCRKGDRVKIKGYLEDRTFTDRNGVDRTVKQLVVEDLSILKAKTRSQAA